VQQDAVDLGFLAEDHGTISQHLRGEWSEENLIRAVRYSKEDFTATRRDPKPYSGFVGE
jgi:hypothetical protein